MDYNKMSKEELIYRLQRIDYWTDRALEKDNDPELDYPERTGWMRGCLDNIGRYANGELDSYERNCIARTRRDQKVQRQAAIQKQQLERS